MNTIGDTLITHNLKQSIEQLERITTERKNPTPDEKLHLRGITLAMREAAGRLLALDEINSNRRALAENLGELRFALGVRASSSHEEMLKRIEYLQRVEGESDEVCDGCATNRKDEVVIPKKVAIAMMSSIALDIVRKD